MTVILLTQEERDRFAAYLEQEARTDDGLARQAETLGATGEMVAKRLRMQAATKAMVARDLRSIESQEPTR